jgi:hypothetical protein
VQISHSGLAEVAAENPLANVPIVALELLSADRPEARNAAELRAFREQQNTLFTST